MMDATNRARHGNIEPRGPGNEPVLVTGAHRTGTTWVGKMLVAGPGMGYISEPLNLWHRPGVLRAATPCWYTYICAENEHLFGPALQETVHFCYHLLAELRSLRERKDFLRMGRDWAIFARGRWLRQRALLKDPFAVFSIPWFSNRLGCRTVVTVRHPLAFAGSLLRLGWAFDFNHLLSQPVLMRDLLEPYRGEMTRMLAKPEDIIGQSGLLWRMIYNWVWQLRASVPDLLVVRHEDLSLNPVAGFRSLYQALAIKFTERVERTIIRSSSAENQANGKRESIYAIRLNSQQNLHTWKHRLNGDQIVRLRQLTGEVASRFYPEASWE
jgi:hypothetical protein